MNPDFLQAELEGDLAEEVRASTATIPAVIAAGPQPDARTAIKRGRTVTNLAANLGNFAFNLLVGLWFTPYMIYHLGTASYGLIPLVTQITGYMVVVTIALNSVVGRFVTIAFEQHDDEEANRFFNTALFANAFLVLALLGPAVAATFYLERLIVVPPGQELQTRLLFACTVAAFFLAEIQSSFGVATFYMNRLDLQNAINVLQQAVRVAIIVGLFYWLRPQVWQVGLAGLLSMCIGWGWTIRLWRRLTPTLHISFACFKLAALRSLLSMGVWVSVNHVGAILFLAIDLLVVNRLFGSESTGRYAATLQWSGLLRTIASVVAGAFTPTIFYLYARNQMDDMVAYTRRAVKFVGLMIALPIGLICGLSRPLLTTWLGTDFVDLAPLMSLLTIHLSINLAVSPMFSVQSATNHVRTPAMVAIAMGALNLALALCLAGPVGWGLYGVAAAGAIALSAKNLFFTPLYTAYILHRRLDAFFWEMLPITTITLGTAAVAWLLAANCDICGWSRLIVAGAALSIAYAVVCYSLVLSREDRALAWSMVPSLGSMRKGN